MKTALFAAAALLAALGCPALSQAAPADLVIWGGPIYTGAKVARAEAVAVAGGRIAYVGDRPGAKARVGPKTQVIDLKGAALFPGFTDSHAHLREIGNRELSLNLEGSKSAAEAAGRVKSYLTAHPGTAPVWGRGWIETGWPEGRFLQKSDIDPIAGSRPVVLTRADGHALVANSAALTAAGIDIATAAPAGGTIERGADQQPTGILIDNAMSLVAKLQYAPTEADRRAEFDAAFKVEAAYGWTGIHSMSVSWDDVLLLETLDT